MDNSLAFVRACDFMTDSFSVFFIIWKKKCYLENLGQGTNSSSFEGVGSWQLRFTDRVAAVGVH